MYTYCIKSYIIYLQKKYFKSCKYKWFYSKFIIKILKYLLFRKKRGRGETSLISKVATGIFCKYIDILFRMIINNILQVQEMNFQGRNERQLTHHRRLNTNVNPSYQACNRSENRVTSPGGTQWTFWNQNMWMLIKQPPRCNYRHSTILAQHIIYLYFFSLRKSLEKRQKVTRMSSTCTYKYIIVFLIELICLATSQIKR